MTPISPEDVKVLVERLRAGWLWTEAADALEAQSRAYVALAERVGVLEEALSQLEGKARLGGDCLGNSPPNFEPCQRSFYMLADIARAALTKDKANG
jgi:hypothetical protein